MRSFSGGGGGGGGSSHSFSRSGGGGGIVDALVLGRRRWWQLDAQLFRWRRRWRFKPLRSSGASKLVGWRRTVNTLVQRWWWRRWPQQRNEKLLGRRWRRQRSLDALFDANRGSGGNITADQLRSFSNRGGNGGSGNSSRNWANIQGGNSSSGSSNDAARQFRGYRGPSGDGGGNRNFAGNSGSGSARLRGGDNPQIEQMFKQYRDQQASANVDGRSFDRSRGRNWSGSGNAVSGGNNTPGGNQLGSNQLPGRPGSGTRRGVDWNRMGGNDVKNGDRLRNGNGQFGGVGNNDYKGPGRGGPGRDQLGNVGNDVGGNDSKGPGRGQFTWNGQGGNRGDFNRGDGNRGDFGRGNGDGNVRQFGQWSKNDNGKWNAKTAEWYGKSGFGDHRGRGAWGQDGGGKGDWNKGDWNKGDWANGKGDWGKGNWGKGKGDWGKGDWNRGDWDGKWHGGGRHDWGNHVRNDWNHNWWNNYGNRGWNWNNGRNWCDVPFAWGWWAGRNNWSNNCYWGGWRNDPWYWWGGCSAPLLTTWVDFGWNTPCYWDYGPGEYITYSNNTVYVDNQRYATALDYYAQVRNLARSVPALTKDQLANIEWLPLGVFAVTRPNSQNANEMVQLAVSKDGILSGTWFDQATGQSRPLSGMVEQATQKAAWGFADSPTDALVVETSLYNLTEPDCSALAHLDAVSTEVWQLTRLQQPQQPAVAQPPAVKPTAGGSRSARGSCECADACSGSPSPGPGSSTGSTGVAAAGRGEVGQREAERE